MNKTLKILLSAAMILAVAVSAVMYSSYREARMELAGLKSYLSESTGVWNGINEKKLAVLGDLNRTKSDLRDASLIIEEAAERTEELEKEIETLEKEIEALTSPAP